MLVRKGRLKSVSRISRVHSLGWRGKDSGSGLQDLRAQVRKFRVSSFILARDFGGLSQLSGERY